MKCTRLSHDRASWREPQCSRSEPRGIRDPPCLDELGDAAFQPLAAFAPGTGPTIFAFPPDAALLALGEFTGAVSLWDWRAGKLLRRWSAHDPFGTVLPDSGGVEALRFSADGARLHTRGPRNGADAVMDWDVATGKALP